MTSIRQHKVASLLQKELAELFVFKSKTLFNGAFITVTTVRISPDLSVAKVYLSFMSVPDKVKMLEQVKEHTKEIRKALGTKIKHQLRIVPELIFYLDDSIDYAMKIEELLKK
jgi:ribosome-binding factor A